MDVSVGNFLQLQAAILDGDRTLIESRETSSDQSGIHENGQMASLGGNSSAKLILPASFGPAIVMMLFSVISAVP